MPQFSRSLRLFCLAAILPGAALSQDIRAASQVPGIEIKALSELPVNPTPVPGDDFCLRIPEGGPDTDAGQKVMDAGWGLMGEVTEGDFTYVAFVGKTTQGTSGSCLLESGNIGVFRGDQLVALAFGSGDRANAIGSLMRLDQGGIRIWDGDYLQVPAGDLRFVEGGLFLLRPIADRDQFCGGAVEVPSLYGLPVDIGRILLLNEGWTPSPADAESREGWGGWVADMAANGIEEVQDCSGTGFGYCGFEYGREGGLTLHVTTAGEGDEGSLPSIVGVGAVCE